MTENDFFTWLDSHLNFEKTPEKDSLWLETMKLLCEKSGHPELSGINFHVAGSKGKGSICCFIASILAAHGKKTGLYTSPHISSFYERITENQKFFDKKIYKAAMEKVYKTATSVEGGRKITWFELVTLLSFLTFREAKTDCNVYEVGLGGRLDSTNVIRPSVSVIGPIELEHTQFLGDTLEKIAFEKSGIIKENTPVIVAPQRSEGVKDVFRKVAKEKNAPITFVDDFIENLPRNCIKVYKNRNDFVVKQCFFVSRSFDSSTLLRAGPAQDDTAPCHVGLSTSRRRRFQRRSEAESRHLFTADLNLLGKIQCENALAAILAVKTVFPEISDEEIKHGLENATLPARFEFLNENEKLPYTILDGAHTVSSVAFTMETFVDVLSQMEKIEGFSRPAHLLFACASDKEVEKIAPLFFKGNFEKITLTRPGETKTADLARLRSAFTAAGIDFDFEEDYNVAIKNAINAAKKENAILLVTGSFYLIAEVKKSHGFQVA